MEDNVRIEEVQNLERCLSRIDEIIAEDERWLQKPKEEGSGHKQTDVAMRRMKERNLQNLKEVRPNPYFGRIDFAGDESPDRVETYYFGKFRIPEAGSSRYPEQYVISFAAPIAKLFYDPASSWYSCPAGRITGKVTLKRILQIERACLIDMKDEYRLLPSGDKQIPAIEKTTLTEELSKSKGESLQDIIPTIAPEQYRGIASAFQQVVIIQGVAGSGKSEVGLHRIVYLLSPHSELNLQISPERVVFFGPSKQFLRYISNLLPDLRVPKVKQTTVLDWLRGTLSSRLRLEQTDSFLEKQLRNIKGGVGGREKVARFKGSLRMARLLERYVRILHKGFQESATDIMSGEQVLVSKAEVRRIIRESQRGPLNEQRRYVLSRIESRLREKSLLQPGQSLPLEIEAQLDRFWPPLDYKGVYLKLLSDRNTLVSVSDGSITEDYAELFRDSLPKGAQAYKIEDLAALCYLDHLLNERVNVRRKGRLVPLFEHVVVDEAQDVSPLEFKLMYLHSQNKSVTVLGDIGQRLLPHKGINSWREVRQVFPKERISTAEIHLSYRATYEITKHANRILKMIEPRIPRAIPYKRHGEQPALVRSKSYSSMVAAIAEDIRSLKAKGIQTIAVLCKTSTEALRLRKRLLKEGIEDAVLLGRKDYERTKTTVSSIYQAKGLEFDAVILANARKNNYPNSVLHNRLLYIGVTRAAHELHIHWFGTLAEILVDPALVPRNKRAKVSRALRKTRPRKG